MTHSRIAQELPFASSSLLSDQEHIAVAILRTKVAPEKFDVSCTEIEQRMVRVKHQLDQLERCFGSAIRLCQIDYRRNVELARKFHPDKEKREHLIQLHTDAYKVACMYACRRYKDNLKLVSRIERTVDEFMKENEHRTANV